MTKLNVFLQGKWFVEWHDNDDNTLKLSIIPLWWAIIGSFLGRVKIVAPWRIEITN